MDSEPSSGPNRTESWESLLPEPAANNVVVLVGVATFALQLVLFLLLFYKCWRYDRWIRNRKHKDSVHKPDATGQITATLLDCSIYSEGVVKATSSRAVPPSPRLSYDEESRLSPATPFLPINSWDLVQQ